VRVSRRRVVGLARVLGQLQLELGERERERERGREGGEGERERERERETAVSVDPFDLASRTVPLPLPLPLSPPPPLPHVARITAFRVLFSQSPSLSLSPPSPSPSLSLSLSPEEASWLAILRTYDTAKGRVSVRTQWRRGVLPNFRTFCWPTIVGNAGFLSKSEREVLERVWERVSERERDEVGRVRVRVSERGRALLPPDLLSALDSIIQDAPRTFAAALPGGGGEREREREGEEEREREGEAEREGEREAERKSQEVALSEYTADLITLLSLHSLHAHTTSAPLYIQGLSHIAGLLLLFLPLSLSLSSLHSLLLQPTLTFLYREDEPILAAIFDEYLRAVNPSLSLSLSRLGVGFADGPLEWFLTCFARSLPLPAAALVLDNWTSEGDAALFRASLSLFLLHSLSLSLCSDAGDAILILRRLPRVRDARQVAAALEATPPLSLSLSPKAVRLLDGLSVSAKRVRLAEAGREREWGGWEIWLERERERERENVDVS
jgi:hypothetical protein